jgi:iron complex outermembrane recepter protein
MIRIRFTTALKAGAALAALTAATPLWAQDEPDETPAAAETAADQQEGDILVTARRREESLLDVPIAITAYSGEQLEAQGALDITDIGDTTPNVTLEVSRGTNSTLTAFIRGVGQQDPVAGFEAGIGIYLDDVYLNRPQAAVLDIYDVERIEVLRGPQGTLYGRNTIGGAIKYVTRRLPRDAELKLRGTIGTYDQADVVASLSTPVGADYFRVGASLARLSRGGFGDNLTTGLENYNKDVWAGRLSAEINNEDDVFIRVAGDYTQDDSNPRGGHRLIPGFASGAPVLGDVFDSRGALNTPEQKVKAYGISLFAEVQPSDSVTLRSITAYRRDSSNTPIDFDALPARDVDVPAIYRNSQTSQELQLLYNSGPLNVLVGGYYLDAQADTFFDVNLAALTVQTLGNVGTETFALFGDLTYDIGQLSVSLGGRYTWDERRTSILRTLFSGGLSPFFGGTPRAGLLTQTDFDGTAEFSQFTPRASVSYRPTDDHMVYASYSKGFKGGGFDPRGVGTSAPDLNGNGVRDYSDIYDFLLFDPETVESYELGWHAQMFDRRLRFSLAAFHADYTDVQVPGSVGATIGGQQLFVGITTNAGKARFQGIEFEGNALLARDFGSQGDSFNFSWSLGWLNADYKEFIDARGIDVADRRNIQNTPEWTASGTLNYGTPVFAGMLNLMTTLSYRSSSQQFELRVPGLDQPGFALWDANLVWRSDDERWSVGLHGRNLTNKKYVVAGYNFLSQNPDTGEFVGRGVRVPVGQPGLDPTLGNEGILTAFYGNPRQFYLTVGLKFR